VNALKNQTDSVVGKMGQDIKCQIRWSGLSMRLLDTLRYILHLMFSNLENCNIWQPFCPGGAKQTSLYTT